MFSRDHDTVSIPDLPQAAIDAAQLQLENRMIESAMRVMLQHCRAQKLIPVGALKQSFAKNADPHRALPRVMEEVQRVAEEYAQSQSRSVTQDDRVAAANALLAINLCPMVLVTSGAKGAQRIRDKMSERASRCKEELADLTRVKILAGSTDLIDQLLTQMGKGMQSRRAAERGMQWQMSVTGHLMCKLHGKMAVGDSPEMYVPAEVQCQPLEQGRYADPLTHPLRRMLTDIDTVMNSQGELGLSDQALARYNRIAEFLNRMNAPRPLNPHTAVDEGNRAFSLPEHENRKTFFHDAQQIVALRETLAQFNEKLDLPGGHRASMFPITTLSKDGSEQDLAFARARLRAVSQLINASFMVKEHPEFRKIWADLATQMNQDHGRPLIEEQLINYVRKTPAASPDQANVTAGMTSPQTWSRG